MRKGRFKSASAVREEGYNVRVANHTNLTGGVILSSQAAEDAGKNRFSTHSIISSNIHNYSRHEGKSFGLGDSFGFNGKGSQQLGDTGIQLTVQGQQNGGVAAGAGLQGAKAGKAIGYGRDGDSQSSITRSGINTKNIHIGSDPTGAQTKAVYTADTVEQLSDTVFDVKIN